MKVTDGKVQLRAPGGTHKANVRIERLLFDVFHLSTPRERCD